ncbi:hypothetical protein DXB08_21675 [Hungatella hathewayi]|uniref:hypothetical protein n=1 Tax=Hungatella TaxID=1649459 RepID=UPI000E453008|nr:MULTISPECIES: hypothetical protein [Hungatella]RGO69271.1 hypothetical protein DXB08_21675 [Hungatella hathewayi]
MQSINFDDGLKSFAINGDEKRVIRFNPADPDMMTRYYKALQMLKEAKGSLLSDVNLDTEGNLSKEDKLGEASRALEETNSLIRKAMNLMFNSDVYDTIFASQSPFCIVRGKYLFEAFMESLQPVLESEIKAYQKASEKRMNKYLKEYHK